jgi:hypothetical protein
VAGQFWLGQEFSVDCFVGMFAVGEGIFCFSLFTLTVQQLLFLF